MRTLPRLIFIFATLGLTAGFGDRERLLAPSSMALASSSTKEDRQAILISALTQIERGQSVNKVLTRGPAPDSSSAAVTGTAAVAPSPSGNLPARAPLPPKKPTEIATACTDCGPKLADVRYASCNSKNSYLEAGLQRAESGSGLMADLLKRGARADTVIKPICMRVALESRFGANTRTFAACTGGQNKAASNNVRPCLSENYFTLINNSFDLVSRCMAPALAGNAADQQSDIRAVYAMLNVESGHHFNIMSPTGAGGSGQFTQSAIADVNKNSLPRVRQLLESQGGDCARLSKEILKGGTPMRAQASMSCDRVSLAKGNPLLNLVYTYALVTGAKRDLKNDLFEDRRFGRFFKDLSTSDQNRLRTELTVWSHNTGMGGLRTPLNALLNTKYRGKTVQNVDRFLAELSEAMKTSPHRANASRGRRDETSKYWPAIKKTLNDIEKNAGGGSCVRR